LESFSAIYLITTWLLFPPALTKLVLLKAIYFYEFSTKSL
jgi:hypothetical protein